MTQEHASTATSGTSHALPAWLAAPATLAMLYYLAVGIVLHFLRPDYSLLQSGMSCYAVGRYGWLEAAAFAFDGLALVALSVGLARSLAPAGRSRAGLGLLGLTGALRILEAVLPTDVPPGPVPRTTTGELHFVVAFLVFLGITAALLIISDRLGRDAAWRPFQRTAKGLALATLAALVLFFADTLAVGLTRGAPVDLNVAGLIEKVFLVAWHLWVLLAALHLRKAPACASSSAP